MPADVADRRPYHREDLRNDLLAAGRAFVREQGHHGLSVRTLAQAVGVSPGAPYHHFKDRRALLLAIALDGYAELAARAAGAVARGGGPRAVLLALCVSFIRFAQANPRLIELMYESELTSPRPDPALLEHQHFGRAALEAQLEAALPHRSAQERTLRLLSLWSTVYGFSALRNKHLLETFEPARMTAEQVAETVMTLAVDAALDAPLDECARRG
jgi:AcrR family transcriptional regulator